ncbi:hypothetical protein BJ170DRAFT_678514 [Xylariales sp. AK1849]|nr:hypothetical protein BJ170DRAFT_678514 [Xylariales sp. AK1849]
MADSSPPPDPLPASFLRRHLLRAPTANSSCSSLHDMPRTRKLRMLVAANGQRDVAYAQAIAIRLLKDSQIETRALLDEIPLRLTHDIIVMENRSLATMAIDADQRTREAIEAARQTAYELVDWADILVLAPIDADHLAKMMSGISDTLLLEVLRAWDVSKKILLVPGMSVQMWENPMTKKQLSKIKRKWNWITVMSPILWHYDRVTPLKRSVSWDGFNDLVGIIKNQAELLSLGHDVEAAAQQALHTADPSRVATVLPPEIWTLIFEYVGDWELARALDVYTNLPTPPEWRTTRATLIDPFDVYLHELEWMILSCPGSPTICQKLSEAPEGLRFVSSLAVKLIIKFSLTNVLTYLETNLSKVFWASFSSKLLPNKASGVYGRTDILDWWNTSPSCMKKEYDAEALDFASRMGYVHVLDWWLRSGLTLKYTETALESASAKGHLLVLEWWRDAAAKDDMILLKPGRSLLAAAQQGQTAILRWWESSGIPVAHSEGVPKIASANGHTVVLDAWRELKGDKLSFDSQVLVAPTRQGHVNVLEWWKQYARGEQDGDKRTHRVEYKTCDIEEALEDSIGDSRPTIKASTPAIINTMLRYSFVLAIVAYLALVNSASAFVFPTPLWPSEILDNCPSVVTPLEPHYFHEYGSERKKIRYGPFTVPSSDISGGMKMFHIENATKPCDDCVITTFQAGLEYPDGTYANMNSSMMLHHLITINNAANETVCPEFAERFFASGNERVAIDFGSNGTMPAGYYLPKEHMSIETELINYDTEARDIVVTIEWEYIPRNFTLFARLLPIYLDASGICGSTDVEPPMSGGAFNLSLTPPFKLNFDRIMTGVGGHIQDGGIDLQVTKNGQIMCDIVAGYGESAAFIDPDGEAHLSSMSICKELGRAVTGDLWSVTAQYDFSKHRPIMEGYRYAPVMGVAIAYAVVIPPHA